MHQGQDYFSHKKQGYDWDPFNFSKKSYGIGHVGAKENPDENTLMWHEAQTWIIKNVRRRDKNCGGRLYA